VDTIVNLLQSELQSELDSQETAEALIIKKEVGKIRGEPLVFIPVVRGSKSQFIGRPLFFLFISLTATFF